MKRSIPYLLFLIAVISDSWGSEEKIYWLPQPSGSFSVGTQVCQPEKADFQVQFWYPCPKTESPSYTPYQPKELDDFLETPKNAPPYQKIVFMTHAIQDAPCLKGKHPVIIFLHGRGDNKQSNTIACCDLASHGYIVASIDHSNLNHLLPSGEEMDNVPDEKLMERYHTYRDIIFKRIDLTLKFLPSGPPAIVA